MTNEEGQVWAAVFACQYVRDTEKNLPLEGRAEFAIELANDAIIELRKLKAIEAASVF